MATAWATIALAGTGMLALVAAYFAWRESHALNEREANRDEQRREHAARDAQASSVAAWPDWSDEDDLGGVEAGARIANHSGIPIYDVVLTFAHARSKVYEVRASQVPPGVHFYGYKAEEGTYRHAGPRTTPLPDYEVKLRFRDAWEREWTRDLKGRLWPAPHDGTPLEGEGWMGVSGAGLPDHVKEP